MNGGPRDGASGKREDSSHAIPGTTTVYLQDGVCAKAFYNPNDGHSHIPAWRLFARNHDSTECLSSSSSQLCGPCKERRLFLIKGPLPRLRRFDSTLSPVIYDNKVPDDLIFAVGDNKDKPRDIRNRILNLNRNALDHLVLILCDSYATTLTEQLDKMSVDSLTISDQQTDESSSTIVGAASAKESDNLLTPVEEEMFSDNENANIDDHFDESSDDAEKVIPLSQYYLHFVVMEFIQKNIGLATLMER